MADVHTKQQRSYNMSRIKGEESEVLAVVSFIFIL